MSYSTVATCAADQAFIDRVVAATAQEAWNTANGDTEFGQQVQDTSAWATRMVYPVAIASDVEAAYASALAAGNPNPGGDESVITDGMILANVQAKWPADPTP